MKKLCYNIAIGALALVFAGSGSIMAKQLWEQKAGLKEAESLAALVSVPDDGGGYGAVDEDGNGDEQPYEKVLTHGEIVEKRRLRLPSYGKLKEENPDFAGWVQVEGTNLDTPVMHTPKEPEYYLKRTFVGESSAYGVPFADAACDLQGSSQIIIYGHHMKNGTIFADLLRYGQQSFLEEHPVIWFDTEQDIGEYQVYCAFYTTGADQDVNLLNYIDIGSEEQFEQFMRRLEQNAVAIAGERPEYGDGLLTLVTCEYSQKDGRFAVLAWKEQ